MRKSKENTGLSGVKLALEEANTCLRELELLVTLLKESTYLMPHLKSALGAKKKEGQVIWYRAWVFCPAVPAIREIVSPEPVTLLMVEGRAELISTVGSRTVKRERGFAVIRAGLPKKFSSYSPVVSLTPPMPTLRTLW